MRKYGIITLLLGIICTICVLSIESMTQQRQIANELIRLHVKADCDTQEAQKLKLKVKDQVVCYLEPLLETKDSVEASKRCIQQNLKQIERISRDVLKKEGVEQKVKAELVTTWFPQKRYGDCTFPAGRYEALQVRIGKAKGHNWWCVLYPGLCFESSLRGVVTEEGKEKLRHVLCEEQMETILHEGRVKVRFRWF